MPIRLGWLGPLVLCSRHLELIPGGLPGVYLLQHFSAASSFPAFYVGQSRDLRRRLAEHGRNGAGGVGFFRSLRTTYFSAAHVLPLQLDNVERSLIRLLAPPANDRTPQPETPILPTLPSFGLSQQEP
jgi:hypothetical protein